MTFNKKTLFILSALSAVLMILSFPMLNFYLLAFVAFVPMSVIIYSNITTKRLLFSFSVFVFVFFGILLSWVSAFMLKATPVYVAIISLLFILVALSIFYTITAVAAKFLIKKFPSIRWIIIPACFAILEYMRTVGFLGFPWGLIGYSQWKFIYFIQIADIVGVIGVGFVLYFVNAIIADMILKYRYNRLLFNDLYLKFPNCFTNNFIIMIVLFILIFAYGIYQINGRYYEYNVAMEKVKIAMIQKSFDPNHKSRDVYTGEPALQGEKGIKKFINSLLLNPDIFTNEETPDEVSRNGTIAATRIAELAREAALHKPSLIVFCESAISDSYQYYVPFVEQNASAMKDFAQTSPNIYNVYLVYQSVVATGSYYLLGSPLIHQSTNTNSKSDYEYYNGATFINTNGNVIGEYGKIKLVPFGEAYPFENSKFFRTVPPFSYLVNFIYKQLDEASVGGWGKWGDTTVFEHPRDGYKFAPSICYESAFGDFTRQFVKKGADVIIVITDDAWSYKDSSLWQHFTMAVFRAVENRKDVLQNANSGVTGHIDAYGHVVYTMEEWKPGYSIADVRLNEVTTIYTKFGEWFVGLLAVFIAILFIVIIIIFTIKKIEQFLAYIKQQLNLNREKNIKEKQEKFKLKEQKVNIKKESEYKKKKLKEEKADSKDSAKKDDKKNIDDNASILAIEDSNQIIEDTTDDITLEENDLDSDVIIESDITPPSEKNDIERQDSDFNIDDVSLEIDETLLVDNAELEIDNAELEIDNAEVIEEDISELDKDNIELDMQIDSEDEVEELTEYVSTDESSDTDDDINLEDLDLDNILNEEMNKQIEIEDGTNKTSEDDEEKNNL